MSRTVSLLGRFVDPATSSDPQVRTLVEKLGAVDYAPAPRPEFRSELRAQLVAIADRVVSEGEPDGPATLDPTTAAEAAASTTVTPLARPASSPRRSVGRRVGRPLGLAAACCAVLALGLGGAVWKSRSALPGDSLYGLKRASENVQLSLASGDTARGHEYLQLASTRIQEAKDLLGQTSALASGSGVQAGGLSRSTVSLIRTTLRSANGDVRSGSSLLGTQAVKSHSASPLSIMIDWAPSELQQLSQLKGALGNGAAQASTQYTWSLVHRALAQARTLQPQVGSQCTAAATNPLGPVGCSTTPKRTPSTTPAQRSSSPARRHHHTARSTTAPHATHPSTHGSSGPTGGTTPGSKHPTGSGAPSSQPAGLLPTQLPSTLPTKLPSTLPVSINSCGISAQVGPIGIGIGSCASGS